MFSSLLRSSSCCSSGWPGSCVWSALAKSRIQSVLLVLLTFAAAPLALRAAASPTREAQRQLTCTTTTITHPPPCTRCTHRACSTWRPLQVTPITCTRRATAPTTTATCCTSASLAWMRPRRRPCWPSLSSGTACRAAPVLAWCRPRLCPPPAHLPTFPRSFAAPHPHLHQMWRPPGVPAQCQVVGEAARAREPVEEETHSSRWSWTRFATSLTASGHRMRVRAWRSSGSLQRLSLTASVWWPSVSLTSSAPSPSSCQHPTLWKPCPRTLSEQTSRIREEPKMRMHEGLTVTGRSFVISQNHLAFTFDV